MDWVLTPDELSAMNLGIFFDAVAVTGRRELVVSAKTAMADMMRGETAHLSRFARAIDQFEDASGAESLMACRGRSAYPTSRSPAPPDRAASTLAIDKGSWRPRRPSALTLNAASACSARR
jgi:CBS domain-containing protein